MCDSVLEIFRKRKIRKFISDVPTGFIPMNQISTVNVIIDVEDSDFDKLKEEIIAWGKRNSLKVNIYFFDFRKLGKEELLLTSIQTTVIKKDLDWIGTPAFTKIGTLTGGHSDLFISMIDNGDFPIEFVSKCTKARFKIGRCRFEGDAYDMVVAGTSEDGQPSRSSEIFSAIADFLYKVR